jgi:NTP pyrophosphatase (non-canonical NTP hydrolase)
MPLTQMSTPLPRSTPKTLAEVQAAMDEFVDSRGWYGPDSERPQLPRNLAASISLEANEVLECFQWSEQAEATEVAAELADVVLYAAQLANVLGIDLGSALDEKLELNRGRFPAVEEERWKPRIAS